MKRLLPVLALAALVAWIAGSHWVAPVTVAMAVISLMILTKVVEWSDIAANKQAWSVLVWFATLVAMADGLNSVGFLQWFANRTVASVTQIPPVAIMVSVVIVFFLIHYLFASSTAHTAAVLPVFLAAMVAFPSVPIRPVTLMLVYSLGLMGVITPYATGPAPIWYGSRYIAGKDFWRQGFIMGAVYLAVLLIVGLPYLLRFA